MQHHVAIREQAVTLTVDGSMLSSSQYYCMSTDPLQAV